MTDAAVTDTGVVADFLIIVHKLKQLVELAALSYMSLVCLMECVRMI